MTIYIFSDETPEFARYMINNDIHDTDILKFNQAIEGYEEGVLELFKHNFCRQWIVDNMDRSVLFKLTNYIFGLESLPDRFVERSGLDQRRYNEVLERYYSRKRIPNEQIIFHPEMKRFIKDSCLFNRSYRYGYKKLAKQCFKEVKELNGLNAAQDMIEYYLMLDEDRRQVMIELGLMVPVIKKPKSSLCKKD